MSYNAKDNSELRQLQLHELNLLKTFADICEQHGLRYYMIGGTMLGAVRHQGFIPWDDDVDVGMPRKDYERFQEIVEESVPDSHYVFLNYKKNSDYMRYFSRLVDTRVTVYNDSNTDTLVENAWIDIFPLDGAPGIEPFRSLRFYLLCLRRVMYHFSCFEQMVNLNRPDRPAYQKLIIWFGMKFKIGRRKNYRDILDRIDAKLKKCPYDQAKYHMNFFGAHVKKEMVPNEWFGEGVRYPFEGMEFVGPKEYDRYLRQMYGDYRTPPSDEHKDKHNISEIRFAGEESHGK